MTTFISYSGDRDARRELVHSLREHGVTPWRDVEDLDAGARTTEEIEGELADCSAAIVWVNQAALASSYVTNIELPAIARAASDRQVRIVPVFEGLGPSEAVERVSRCGIEIGDSNGHVVDPNATGAATAHAIASACAAAQVREAKRQGRLPIVRMVTYDDTADHRDDAVLNFDWRHRLGQDELDDGAHAALSQALRRSTTALKTAYGGVEVSLAVKAHLPIAVAVGHAFAEPTGCTIRMSRDAATYTVSRSLADAEPLREAPRGRGPVDERASAVEVAVSRDTESGVNEYVGAGRRYRERLVLTPLNGPGRFALEDSDSCNVWAHQTAALMSRLAAKPGIEHTDLFLACPIELAVAVGWWANAIGPITILNWTGRTGPYAPMWRLP